MALATNITNLKAAAAAIVSDGSAASGTQSQVATTDITSWLGTVREILPIIAHQWWAQRRPEPHEPNEGNDPKVDRATVITMGNGDRLLVARLRP